MQTRISISPPVFQALQLAFLAGARLVCEPAELFRFGAAAKGKTKGAPNPFISPLLARLLGLATFVAVSAV